MKLLESYHLIWLHSHPERSEKWLRQQLSEGFHIHHINGDHFDDDFANLVLIEGSDHLRLHGIDLVSSVRRKGARGPRKSTLMRGAIAYDAKARGEKWTNAGQKSGGCGNHAAAMAAMKYAQRNNLPWPPESKQH
jgi:hypothetical protein